MDETEHSSSHLVVVNPTTKRVVMNQPTLAQSIIIHPHRCIAALRNGSRLQIFNLEIHVILKNFMMSEDVLFWKWVSPYCIGIVTPTAVYHWEFREDDPDDQREPFKVFDRESNLPEVLNNQTVMPAHVVNYHISASGTWCLLVSVTFAQSGEFLGEMQLFSIEKQISQILCGRNGAFTYMRLEGRMAPSEVLCFEHKDEDGVCMIRIMEVGFDPSTCASGSSGSAFKTEPVVLQDMARQDFPVAVAVCPKYQLLYVFTSNGYVYLIGIESGVLLHHQHLEVGTIFSANASRAGGVFYLKRNDTEVIHLTVDIDELSILLRNKEMSFVLETLKPGERHPIPVLSGSNTTEESLLDNGDVFDKPFTPSAPFSTQLHVPTTVPPTAPVAVHSNDNDQKANNDGRWRDAPVIWNNEEIVDVFDTPPPPPVPHIPTTVQPSSSASASASTVAQSNKKGYETETLWDSKLVQHVFDPPHSTAAATSSSSSFDFSLPEASPEHHHPRVHHVTDHYQMSTMAFPPSPVKQKPSNNCAECTQLLKQLGESLDALDKAQAENLILKENVNTLTNRTKMLFTAEDCDLYEEELLQCFQKVKERKLELSREKERKEYEQKYCVICQERIRNVILLPCGHICLCETCVQSNNIQSCPLDRKKIETYQVVYF